MEEKCNSIEDLKKSSMDTELKLLLTLTAHLSVLDWHTPLGCTSPLVRLGLQEGRGSEGTASEGLADIPV